MGELAKLVKDFVLCLVENILVWPIKKLMPPEWLMTLAKQMELNQKTKFLHPKNLRKSKKQDSQRDRLKRQTRKEPTRRQPKPRKLRRLSKEKINKFVTFQ